MKRLILMMQFLTKFPLPFDLKVDEDDFSKGAIWFPMVGLIIGLVMWAIYAVMGYIDNSLVAITVVVAFQVFITGGLHLDGLADMFDGLYSYRDKERMLEIMKDSRVGTNGVLILVIGILLKVALLSAVDPEQIVFVFLLMPAYARFMGMVLAKFSKYAREKGMGGFFIGKVTHWQLLIMSVMIVLMSLVKPLFLVALPIMCLLTFLFRGHVYSKIDGITGDVLGAWIEMSELIFLFIVVMI